MTHNLSRFLPDAFELVNEINRARLSVSSIFLIDMSKNRHETIRSEKINTFIKRELQLGIGATKVTDFF